MLDHFDGFDGSFQAFEKNWRLLPNVAEDRALFNKTAFYSKRVEGLVGTQGIQEIHNIFKIGRNVKQVFHGNNSFNLGFDGVQHFASIPKNIEITRSTFPYILKDYPIICCRGTYNSSSFGTDRNGFNAEYFPDDLIGKRIEYCRDYILFTPEDIRGGIESFLKQYDETFLNHLFGKLK